jgi:two-component system NarL family sensor kinase
VVLVVALLVTGAAVLGGRYLARAEAHRTAEHVGTQIAGQVVEPLETYDLGRMTGSDRAAILARVAPYRRAGMIHRVSIWTVGDRTVEIVLSDRSAPAGGRRSLDPELAARWSDGGSAVVRVPDDHEPRAEIAEAGRLMEVFTPFRDSAGRASWLELYVPVPVAEATWGGVAVLAPVSLVGTVLLGGLLMCGRFVLAREVDRYRREHRGVLQYGWRAADTARHDVARDLHDNVLPGLAGARLLLDSVGAEEDGSPAGDRVRRARELIVDDVERIRGLLTGLTSDPLGDEPSWASFENLAARHRVGGRAVLLDMDPELSMPADVGLLLHRAAGELLRNAVVHGGACRVEVRVAEESDGGLSLQVTDDGRGFDPRAGPRPGHVGLILVRRSLEAAGGRLAVSSSPGAGTTVVAVVPRSVDADLLGAGRPGTRGREA